MIIWTVSKLLKGERFEPFNNLLTVQIIIVGHGSNNLLIVQIISRSRELITFLYDVADL